MAFETIEAEEFKKRIRDRQDYFLIDVRTPAEYAGKHIQGAINLPIDSLDVQAVRDRFSSQGHDIYVVCQSGGRSRKACQQLAEAGIRVINVQGGTSACAASNIPCVSSGGGKSVMALDRQVRIAAGSLILLGVLLGIFVHPACYLLSAFVGAGLVFSGVTDTCGMGMILAKMPWNQVRVNGSKTANVQERHA
jgi:rhodanese-related sulfurtransferase